MGTSPSIPLASVEVLALDCQATGAHPGGQLLEIGWGLCLAVIGFPFVRHDVRDRFPAILESTDGRGLRDDVRLLCLHQCVEGARVGPRDYVFRSGDDVIRGRDVPQGFAAVLAGHVHRSQVLTRDLQGRELGTPVLYAGSIERTSIAERDEEDPAGDGGARHDPSLHEREHPPGRGPAVSGRHLSGAIALEARTASAVSCRHGRPCAGRERAPGVIRWRGQG